MSNLPLTELKPEQAIKRDFSNCVISEKKDGTLIYYKDGKLFSPRCERSDRFKHILKILKEHNCPEMFGEMFYGKNVFDVSRSENWSKACFYPIDLEDKSLAFEQRMILLKQLVSEISSPFIVPLVEFSDFKTGWNFVKENNAEGLVIRNNREWIKVKCLKENKEEIIRHEAGSEKGCFILKSGNRVSGTSRDFVAKFNELKAQGKIPIAECEFPFYTEENKMFQPRLRRVFAQGEENE